MAATERESSHNANRQLNRMDYEPLASDTVDTLRHLTLNLQEPSDQELHRLAQENEEDIVGVALKVDIIEIYLRELHQFPLLDATTEVQLAQTIEAGREALGKRDTTKSPKRIISLDKQIQKGRDARDTLIRSNTRLVVSRAKHYLGRGLQFPDLIQEGNLGLIKATDRYDWRRGHRFSTYAVWWIRQHMTRAIADFGRTIRLPVHVIERASKLTQASRRLTQELGREPTIGELAHELQVPEQRVKKLLVRMYLPVSLSEPMGEEEGDYTLEDKIMDTAPSVYEQSAQRALRDEVQDMMIKLLTPKEQRVLEMRYGLKHDQTYTLEEVGNKFSISRERVRQIEEKALLKLKRDPRFKTLKTFWT